MSRRIVGWGLLAAGVTGAVLFVAQPEGGKPSAAGADRSPAAQAKAQGLPASVQRAPLPREMAGELFAGAAAAPHPERRAHVVEKPVMPAFPYKYAGWLRGGRSPEVYLEHGGRVFPVKVGDVLEGFRVDAIRGERIDLTYMALGERTSVLMPVAPDGAGRIPPQAADAAPGLNVAGTEGEEAGYRPSRE